jgi:hypothetical protein
MIRLRHEKTKKKKFDIKKKNVSNVECRKKSTRLHRCVSTAWGIGYYENYEGGGHPMGSGDCCTLKCW